MLQWQRKALLLSTVSVHRRRKRQGKVNEIFLFFFRAISFKNSFTLLTLTYFLIEKHLGCLQGRRTKAWEGCNDHVEPAQNSSQMWQPSAQVSRHFSEGLKRNTAAHPPLKLCYFSPSLLQLRTKGWEIHEGVCSYGPPVPKEMKLDRPIPFTHAERHKIKKKIPVLIKFTMDGWKASVLFLLLAMEKKKMFLIKILLTYQFLC